MVIWASEDALVLGWLVGCVVIEDIYLWVGVGAFCAVVLRRGWWGLWEVLWLAPCWFVLVMFFAIVMLMLRY